MLPFWPGPQPFFLPWCSSSWHTDVVVATWQVNGPCLTTLCDLQTGPLVFHCLPTWCCPYPACCPALLSHLPASVLILIKVYFLYSLVSFNQTDCSSITDFSGINGKKSYWRLWCWTSICKDVAHKSLFSGLSLELHSRITLHLWPGCLAHLKDYLSMPQFLIFKMRTTEISI